MTKLYVISGHGAGDPGAGGNGYNEADVARLVSSRLKALGSDSVVELDKNINWYASGRVDSALKKIVGKFDYQSECHCSKTMPHRVKDEI